MSQFICPLCGKSNSIEKYDPSEFDLDVWAKEQVGLGRGRGFKEVSRWSLLGNGEALADMSTRLLALVGLFYENGHITREDVLEQVGGDEGEESESSEAEAQLANLEREIDDLADTVWHELETEEEAEGNEEAIDRLSRGIRLMVAELEASKAIEESEEGEG